MGDLSEVTIGDLLFVKGSHYDKGRLEIVERVTPSGRVITKAGQYDPSGRMRGQRGWQSRWARLATAAANETRRRLDDRLGD